NAACVIGRGGPADAAADDVASDVDKANPADAGNHTRRPVRAAEQRAAKRHAKNGRGTGDLTRAKIRAALHVAGDGDQAHRAVAVDRAAAAGAGEQRAADAGSEKSAARADGT